MNTRANLISMVILALAGAGFEARAQSFDPATCGAVAMGSMVETELNAFCRGYNGGYCVGEEYTDACEEGVYARSHDDTADGMQRSQAQADEMAENRRLVQQLPELPPESNPLLGRWRNIPAPPPSNILEDLMGLGSAVACTLIAGEGPFFEFRADALVHGARTMDSMRYYRGKDGVLFAVGERYVGVLAFELDGRDRISNGTCSFERVGAAAAAPSPSSKPPAGPVCGIPTTRLGVDTVASVERDIEARGGSASSSPGGLAKLRMSTLSGDYADVGNAMAVNYDFDSTDPAGKMVAVTIVRHAMSTPEFDRMLAERKATITAGVGPLQQKSATELQASAANGHLTLITNAPVWFLYEVYRLP